MRSGILNTASQILLNEANAIRNQSVELNSNFENAVMAMMATKGKVVVTGIGKSGIIGRKISATLASTGTPSFFLHPTEAFHGDLGMVTRDDLVFVLSNSGESDEILKILPYFRENGNTIISMSSNPQSTMSQNSDIHISIMIKEEACPLNLAPTTSSTVMLAMGDAIALSIMKINDFSEENYARFHPGGALGRKLLTKVEHKMRTGNLPIICEKAPLHVIINTMSKGRLGLAIINQNKRTTGIITDGDLRRLLEAHGKDAWDLKAYDFMTKHPKTVLMGTSLHEAEERLKQLKITSLIVVDNNCNTVGVIQIYDLK
jgi:arabinose-5-phosphate isomerase